MKCLCQLAISLVFVFALSSFLAEPTAVMKNSLFATSPFAPKIPQLGNGICVNPIACPACDFTAAVCQHVGGPNYVPAGGIDGCTIVGPLRGTHCDVGANPGVPCFTSLTLCGWKDVVRCIDRYETGIAADPFCVQSTEGCAGCSNFSIIPPGDGGGGGA